jgi:lysophospholipase L1-like esterase
MNIIVFGSSSAYGAGDPEGGWVARLRRELEPETVVGGVAKRVIYNLGVFGGTSEGVRQRFVPEIEARLKLDEPGISIVAIGGNDAAYIPSRGVFRTSPERFAENIRYLLGEGAARGSVIVQGLTPVNDAVTKVQVGRDRSKTNAYAKRYDDLLRDACHESGTTFVDSFEAFIAAGHLKLLCADGVHPNAAGHAILCRLMKDVLG